MNIDVRTKWKDAQDFLREDQRYKNIDDPREREDLYRDFILELEKKEREDLMKFKDKATAAIKDILKALATPAVVEQLLLTTSSTSKASSSSPSASFSVLQNSIPDHMKSSIQLITIKSNWNDYRNLFADLLLNKNEFKMLNEGDCRRAFLDFTKELEETQRLEEKKKKDLFYSELDRMKGELKSFLTNELMKEGFVNAFTRWKEFIVLPQLINSTVYQQLLSLVTNPATNPTTKKTIEEFQNELLRDLFDSVMIGLQEQYKDDRHYVKKFCYETHSEIEVETKFGEWKERLMRKCGLVEKKNPLLLAAEGEDGHKLQPGEETEERSNNSNNSQIYPFAYEIDLNPRPSPITPVVPVAATPAPTNISTKTDFTAEEGEEIEETPKEPLPVKQPETTTTTTSVSNTAKPTETKKDLTNNPLFKHVQDIFLTRPWNLKDIFYDLHETVVQEYEENKRVQRKNEEKYLTLLKEHFYLSDHVGMKWEDAKPLLQRRSAYEALNRSDRKRLFSTYMNELSEKLNKKSLAMKAYEIEPGEYVPPVTAAATAASKVKTLFSFPSLECISYFSFSFSSFVYIETRTK
jgi:hypothetical protein